MASAASTGATGATLGGTTTQAAVSGLATFSTLMIDKAAGSYTLTASATGLWACQISFHATVRAEGRSESNRVVVG